MRPACKGLVYKRQSLVCHLLANTSERSVVKQRGDVLIVGFNRNTEVDGTNEIDCNVTECEIVDSRYGLSGNMYNVKSTVMFEGNSNGISRLYLTCEESGQWRPWKEGKPDSVQSTSVTGDCSDVTGPTGLYWVPKTKRPIFCDMETTTGRWLVFQRREDGSIEFYRNWANYTTGFGRIGGEFWMGLQPLYELLAANTYEMRIDMTKYDGSKGFASYGTFSLGARETNYRLIVDGFMGSNVGDSLRHHNGRPFTTFDRDNDISEQNCAVVHTGAWWYLDCLWSNLNGRYSNCMSACGYAENINWATFTGDRATLTRVEMKIRRMYTSDINAANA